MISPATVVTGATGHLGANVVRALLERGDAVRCLVRRNTAGLEGLPAELVRGDVTNTDSLRAAFDGARVVIHSAAFISLGAADNDRVRAINVDGTANVLRAAREAGVERVVFVSSAFAYAMAPLDAPVTEARPYETTTRAAYYDRSKADAERLVKAAVADGLDAVIVNPTSLVGPVDPGPSKVGQLLLDLYHRQLPALIQGGFDFVDVRDAAAGVASAAERGERGENYILAGRWASLPEIATIAQGVSGRRAPRVALPIGVARLGVPAARLVERLTKRRFELTHAALDALGANRDIRSDKAQAQLGFASRPLADSVADFYAWQSDRGVIAWRPPASHSPPHPRERTA